MPDVHGELLEHYNYYRAHTQQFRQRCTRWLKSTPVRKEQLHQLLQWCAARQLDPHRFIYSQFVGRQWVFAPPLHQLVPKSKQAERKALARYEQLRETPMFQRVVAAQVQQARTARTGRPHVWDPNKDLSHASEALKRRYLETAQFRRCIAETPTHTYGYHPRSTVCARCPVAHECAVRLQASVTFDILALRRGQTTAATVPGGQYGSAATAKTAV